MNVPKQQNQPEHLAAIPTGLGRNPEPCSRLPNMTVPRLRSKHKSKPLFIYKEDPCGASLS